MRVIGKRKFRCLIWRQKETQIVHFVEQILLYKLIYQQKFQLLVSDPNTENTKMYGKIFRPNYFFRPFQDFLITLKQKQTQNLWAHIRREHKILVLTHSFWLIWNTFKQAKNEQAFCAKTFDPPVRRIMNQFYF